MEQGVFTATKKDGSISYRAAITIKSKHISLGSFNEENVAGQAYKDALMLYSSNISIDDYIDNLNDYKLSLEKAVSIINYRDNGMYISTPIYISRTMFYYYLSETNVLKFDADELFYYSSHKIMKRGNHLFVSDFGNQINIHSRYGIRPHSVNGRDYRFKNGDSLDFRTTNIEILNTFYGVSTCKHKGRTKYKAVIHTTGNFTAGHYDTPVEAAVAYNKAADILQKNGYTKVYPRNELNTMQLTRAEYDKLYHSVIISYKIQKYNL